MAVERGSRGRQLDSPGTLVLNLAETEVELHRLGRARERIEELTGDMDFQEHLHMRGAVSSQGRIALTSEIRSSRPVP